MEAKTHKDFTRERLSSHFVYESFDKNNNLFFNRGSIGFILKGWPLVGASLQAQSEISEFLKNEDNLPSGSSFQVTMIGTSNIEAFLTNWSSFRKGEIFQTLAKYRTDFLRKRASEDGVIKDIFLLISITLPTKNFYIKQIQDIERRRDALKSTLNSIGLFTEDLTSFELINILRLFFGWKLDSHSEINLYDSLSEQILRGDFSIDIEKDKLILHEEDGDVAMVTMEVINNRYARPKTWTLAMMDLFLGNELRKGEQVKSDFIQSFCLQILPRQSLETSKSLAKRETLAKNIKSGLIKWIPGLEDEYEDMDEAILQIQQGARSVIISQNIILKDKVDRIKERVHEYRSMLRRSGFHFIPCMFDHLPVLLSCLPMQPVEEVSGIISNKIGGIGIDLNSLGRGIKTISNEAQALLPIIGEWKGDLRSPGFMLAGRRGQLMYWSPFGPVLITQEGKTPESNENFNLCIAGVPGSGKSVFMQELMLSTLGVGGKVFVLDYGRSFKRTCQILSGNYIEFDLKNPISLNPFSEISELDEDFESREDALSGIAVVLGTMAAPMEGTNDLQNAMLQKALRGVWSKKKSRSEITDIADWLLERDEPYSKDLGNMLYPFTREGIYGKFFAGKACISLNHKIVVIETDHLRNVPALLTVVVQMMIVHINQSMVKGDRKYPSLIMIDEAWKLLQGKSSGAFIEEAGRIARKYKASITLATQQLTDYFRPESPAAEKAFENSSWKAILKQNPESLLAMRSNPKLAAFVKDDWQLDLMQSIHSNPPHYSEIALFGLDVRGVPCRLMLDPFTMLLTSTNADDVSAVESRVKQGLSISDSIIDILKERGMG